MAAKVAELKGKAFKAERDALDVELAKPNPGVPEVTSQVKVINAKAEAYVAALSVLLEDHLSNGADDEYLETEKVLSQVQRDLDAAEKKAHDFLVAAAGAPSTSTTGASTVPVGGTEYKVKLPKLKLQEFEGEVRQWLSFWAGFEELHKNATIPDADKYQYLLQCIPDGSKARKCIDSFPVCAKNYPNAIDVLKKTFGREKMLVKVYVRDLLQNVIRNALQKNSVDLVEVVPKLASQIRNLEELGVTSDKCEDILYPVVESCLPEEVLLAWQRNPAFTEKLDDILAFLNSEVQNQMERSLAKMDFNTTSSSSQGKKQQKTEKQADVPTASALTNVNASSRGGGQCVFCEGKRHKSYKCYKAKTMTVKEKQDVLRRKQLCFICMKAGHRSTECNSTVQCGLCSGKHYDVMCQGAASSSKPDVQSSQTMMAHNQCQNRDGFLGYPRMDGYHDQGSIFYNSVSHQPPPPPQPTNIANSSGAGTAPQQTSSFPVKSRFSNVNSNNRSSLLTLLVGVETKEGIRTARVFIDEGSDESYVEEETAGVVKSQKVGTQVMRHQLFGGGVTAPQSHPQLKITLRSLNGTASGSYVFNSTPKIAQCILKPVRGEWVDQLQRKGVFVQDQSQYSEKVQFLIGMDIAAQIWTGGFVRINSSLYARESIFGWVIGGQQQATEGVKFHGVHMVTSMMLRSLQVDELWSLEALGIVEESKGESRRDLEQAALEHFEESVEREADGRYKCGLPWIKGHKELLSNRSQAVARLKTTTSKLKAEGLLGQYDSIFRNWLEDGVIEQVPESDSTHLSYYLPHRHVIKESSTTPVRPVFDASARAAGGVSLNDCLEKGPNMLELIPALMTRFRMHRVGVTADIKKAFLQMAVAEQDRHVLKFCWWKDLSCKEIQEFQHKRVVFGVTSSPFLLAATLQYHLKRCNANDKEVACKLLRSFYVDNSLCSFDSWEEAEGFKEKSQELLLSAKFDLRGWEMGPAEEEKLVPVLGMMWNTKEDSIALCLESTLNKTEKATTKRGLLSAVNSVFDPMGFVSPFTIIPKLLFQKCCEMGFKWDDELPPEILEPLSKWKLQVSSLQEVKIPRWVSCYSEGKSTLHIFSDASGFAFSCCVYLRTESKEGTVTVQLIMSKSRVAPIKKKQTIPRLELLGCLIGVRLTQEVKKYLDMPDISCTYWTDSSTALAWIVNDKQWGRFVQARVDEIRKNTTGDQWRHVPGEYNPADLPSRGCAADRLLQLQWWEGPDWLRKSSEFWPKSNVNYNETEILDEVKKTVVAAYSQKKPDALDEIRKYSNYNTMLRVVSYIARFVDCLRRRADKRKRGVKVEELQLQKPSSKPPRITAADIERAQIAILSYIQRTGFDGEQDPRLKKFSSFTDLNGVIRTKTQLFFGNESYGVRCPAMLPNHHEVVKAIILTEHINNSHAGVNTTMALLRNRYWILKGRRTISSVVNNCAKCRRFTAKRCVVPGAPLPQDRIKDTCAFDITGVDLLGPLFLKGGEKIWVVLYTCAVLRCVHLEVTSTLSTEGFLKTFRRFVDRRGRPSKMYSDNGLNFVGCQNLFEQIDWDEVSRYAAVRAIEWVFNPPTAAWWGGWWERLVGLTKKLLRRILGKSVVNYEDFVTILCDVEATLNQRPLGYMSDRHGDLVPLCPVFYMKDNPACGLPEADVIDCHTLKEHAQRCQKLREALRSRFRKEYLAQLQHHAGCEEITANPGDVVIVESDDRKRTEWALGLVKEVYPGRDGKFRTALVKTKTGEFLRPMQRLFILESIKKDDVKKANESQDQEADVPVQTRSGRNIKKPDRLTYE